MRAGGSLPLVSPEPTKVSQPEPEERPTIPKEYQQPKGRMLIFWGCGEHAKAGQPIVIDFAQMTPANLAAGKMPPGLEMLSKGLALSRMTAAVGPPLRDLWRVAERARRAPACPARAP